MVNTINTNLTPEILQHRETYYYICHEYPPAPHIGAKEKKRFASVYPDSPWLLTFEKADRLYAIWRGMRRRCYGSGNDKFFKYYRDKGITICDEWRYNFDAFYNWAMFHGYAIGLTIDRIDSDGNYCPENCRWVTRSENSRNKKPRKAKVAKEPPLHLTEEEMKKVETLVDIINRLPAEDKRVLEAYARGVVDKTEAIKEGGEHND